MSDGTSVVVEGTGANHLHAGRIITGYSLYIYDNRTLCTEECVLTVIGDGIDHAAVDYGISRQYDLTGLAVHDRISQYLTDDTAAPAQLLGNLIAANGSQIIALRVKEQSPQKLLGIVYGRRLARTQAAINLDEGFLTGSGAVTLQNGHDARIVIKQLGNILVSGKTQSTEEN